MRYFERKPKYTNHYQYLFQDNAGLWWCKDPCHAHITHWYTLRHLAIHEHWLPPTDKYVEYPIPKPLRKYHFMFVSPFKWVHHGDNTVEVAIP